MNDISCQVFINNRLGLHARAAIKLVELAQSFTDTVVTVSNQTKSATADSVMGLLMLESAKGQQITISASGTNASKALDAVTALIEAGFDEDS